MLPDEGSRREVNMLGKTHMAVGVASALTIMHPNSLSELIVGTGVAALGALINDIDVDTSDSHKGADRVTILTLVVVLAVVLLENFFKLGIYERLMQNSNLMRVVGGCLVFVAVCAFGKEQPHRSFMHSILAWVIFVVIVNIIFPMAAPYFGIAFASHIVLDLLNYKRLKLLYPSDKGFSLNLCYANRLANKILLIVGTAWSVVIFLICLVQIIFK
ncbi:MAG: metal-dependent hydrolase [Lachnospiraceae bacterium]